jgi:N6-adenosine-specific RNA methylase IME4
MSGKYRTLVADPPWDHSEGTGAKWKTGFGDTERELEGDKPKYELPYPVMSLDEIKALPVRNLADWRNAHLYLWVTNKYLRHAWDVAEAWGFRPVRLIVWCKEPRGWNPGGTWPSTAEFCLFGMCGTAIATQYGQAPSQWYIWPRRLGPPVRAGGKRQTMHSAKPEAFLDEVEKVSPGPYLELFARRQRLGWDTWGNEALEHVELST